MTPVLLNCEARGFIPAPSELRMGFLFDFVIGVIHRIFNLCALTNNFIRMLVQQNCFLEKTDNGKLNGKSESDFKGFLC